MQMKKIFFKILIIIESYIPQNYLITVVSLFLAALIFGNINNINAISSGTQLLSYSLFNFIFSIIIIAIINYLHKENTIKFLRFDNISLKDILLVILLGIIITIFFIIFDNYIGTLDNYIGRLDDNKNLDNLGIMINETKNIYFFSVLLSIIAAVSEETLRVFAFEKIKKNFSKSFLFIFILLYSFLFGYFHLTWGIGNVISAVIFSIIVMLIYLWRRSIYILIIIHLFKDVISFIILSLLTQN